MRILIRADASSISGMGHVMRCATLGRALRRRGAEVGFICRPQPGDSIAWLKEAGFPVITLPPATEALGPLSILPTDAAETVRAVSKFGYVDWLVDDHYGIDAVWEGELRSSVGRIMAIDDSANRPHDCDFLLDQNFYLNADRRYDGLLPDHCRKFLGPGCVLLREEFYDLKKTPRLRDGSVRRIMCFFGAADATGETLKALAAIKQLKPDSLSVDVVVGKANPARDRVAALCAESPMYTYHCQTNTIAELCARADLALAAGGSANWERSFLGLPSQVIVTAENQMETTQAVASVGGIWLLGETTQVTVDDIALSLQEALHSPKRLQKISRTALDIMETHGPHGVQALIESMLQ
jgi:UDP-2,4-diacetamido-2,4,6-trideoxy-beta-L-altropyranose hydrolase